MINLITKEQLKLLLKRCEDDSLLPEDEGLFIVYDNDKYIAVANECNDCYVEEFYSLDIALNYLIGNYEDIKLLYALDEAIKKGKDTLSKIDSVNELFKE